jgi:hypothetical protein
MAPGATASAKENLLARLSAPGHRETGIDSQTSEKGNNHPDFFLLEITADRGHFCAFHTRLDGAVHLGITAAVGPAARG